MCNCGQEEACGKNSQTEGGGGKGGHPECHVWEVCHSGQEEPPSCDSHPCDGQPCVCSVLGHVCLCDGHPCICSVLGYVCPCDGHPCVCSVLGYVCPCICSVLGHVCLRCTACCTCPYVYFLFLLTINSPDRVYCVYISCFRNP